MPTTVIKILEDADGDRVYFSFPFNADAVAAFRHLPSQMIDRNKDLGWDAENKWWVFPLETQHVIEGIIEETHHTVMWKFVESEDEL